MLTMFRKYRHWRFGKMPKNCVLHILLKRKRKKWHLKVRWSALRGFQHDRPPWALLILQPLYQHFFQKAAQHWIYYIKRWSCVGAAGWRQRKKYSIDRRYSRIWLHHSFGRPEMIYHKTANWSDFVFFVSHRFFGLYFRIILRML